MKKLFFAITFLFLSNAYSQQISIHPTGIQGSAGFGFVHFDIDDPNTQQLDLKQGVYASVGGEKGFGFLNSYLTISLNYLKTDGQAKYKYVNTDGTYTSSSLVDLGVNLFQAGLGLKFKLIDDSWFRPYIEGGGLFGYYQIQYKNLTSTSITGPNTNFLTRDSIFDLGHYGEAGLEIVFSDTFGIKVAFRETWNKTKAVETLGSQEIKYKSQVYYLSLLKKF
jgi:hypothetical protein